MRIFPLELLKKINNVPLFSKTFEMVIADIYGNKDFDIYNITLNNKLYKIEHYWNIIDTMQSLIEKYVELYSPKNNKKKITIIGNENKCYIDKSVQIKGNIIINTENGPVIVDDNTILKNFTIIEGPAYIGKNNVLDNAVIRGPVITGKVCKLSGEIEESFIMDYVNKHHYGFIGHTIIENWVNLGAGTTNSDLKNNYSNIKMYDGNSFIDTKKIKMGCIIGEHTKTAIGTMINTGTIIGPFSNIFGELNNKYIPPFSWGTQGEKYKIEKLLDTITRVMKRRNVTPSNEYIDKIKLLYDNHIN